MSDGEQQDRGSVIQWQQMTLTGHGLVMDIVGLCNRLRQPVQSISLTDPWSGGWLECLGDGSIVGYLWGQVFSSGDWLVWVTVVYCM